MGSLSPREMSSFCIFGKKAIIMKREGEIRIPSGCAISAVISREGRRMTGEAVMKSMIPMHDRSNGLGGGFAAYGIYPDYRDFYAFHIFFDDNATRRECEALLKEGFELVQAEQIPIHIIPEITDIPLIWRYFVSPLPSVLHRLQLDEKEFVARTVMDINTKFKGAYVFSSGKNMGVFKAVGYPEDVGRFYRLDEYAGYSWTAHGRYPTNTPGWWGGAHPFALLDYSVVHNGEISSYDANRRFIEMFGYKCTLQTDTEVITYIADYLLRRQGMSLEEAANVIAHLSAHGVFQSSYYGAVLHRARLQRRADGAQRPAEAPLDGHGGERRSRIHCKRGGRHPRDGTGREQRLGADGRRAGHRARKGGEILMAIEYIYPPFEVIRRNERCTRCRICEKQCANGVHTYDAERKIMLADESKCVNCQRCVALCPTRAIKIVKTDCCLRENENWKSDTIREVYKQAATGGILLSSTGNPTPLPGYWDRLLINASQVTNPSIDPLREPMETRVFLGKKPDTIRRRADGSLDTTLPPQLELSVPILFSAMSYGSISYNAHAALARAAEELGIYYNTGEGGLHRDFYKYGANTIVQVASGRFGIEERCLNAGAAIEIKMGQGAKPGIGGHLPGAKIVGDVSKTRMIPEGSDAISPAPHHDIYSIEDLRQLVYSLKEATQYKKPVIVKVAAVHNIAAIASGIARSGADIIAIDGYRGGTGAAPTRIRDNVGIPIELALAAVDQRLRDEGIRSSVSLIAGGSIRSSADVVKAIALGADACYIGTAALLALGCHLCRSCHTGRCNWGIATQNPELVKRLDPDVGAERLVNLVTAWKREIKEMMGGMGINSIEALRGNRVMLRGIGLTEKELEILGVAHAGE